MVYFYISFAQVYMVINSVCIYVWCIVVSSRLMLDVEHPQKTRFLKDLGYWEAVALLTVRLVAGLGQNGW